MEVGHKLKCLSVGSTHNSFNIFPVGSYELGLLL